jgi:hypothetical protein
MNSFFERVQTRPALKKNGCCFHRPARSENRTRVRIPDGTLTISGGLSIYLEMSVS